MIDYVWGSILSDQDIRSQLEIGGLKIDPLYEPIQPASVDLRLGDKIIIPEKTQGVIDPHTGILPEYTVYDFLSFTLPPNGFVLVSTLEWIEIPPHLVGILVGKSKLARLGLQVESAGYVDPGWKGRLTFELKNLGEYSINLWASMLIAQIRFQPIFSQPCSRLYGDPVLASHYQGAEGPEGAKPDVSSPVLDPQPLPD